MTQAIEVGRSYWVDFAQAHLEVRIVGRSELDGSWEGVSRFTGMRMTIPEGAFAEEVDAQPCG
jgi:hypothetical protein